MNTQDPRWKAAASQTEVRRLLRVIAKLAPRSPAKALFTATQALGIKSWEFKLSHIAAIEEYDGRLDTYLHRWLESAQKHVLDQAKRILGSDDLADLSAALGGEAKPLAVIDNPAGLDPSKM
jgi:hypothetical protein